MDAVAVLSPHCDDAVFGAGDFIASHPGATVVTIFAGGPDDGALGPWDVDCGFVEGDDVMAHRRAEDADALACLGARGVWLPFRDEQYGRDVDARAIAERLDEAVQGLEPGTVAIPLGLFHRDHELASDAALLVADRRPHVGWLAYEDAIYRALPGDLVRVRVGSLHARGYALERWRPGAHEPASPLKRRAVACYVSQLRGLASSGRAGHADALAPERWWRVRPA